MQCRDRSPDTAPLLRPSAPLLGPPPCHAGRTAGACSASARAACLLHAQLTVPSAPCPKHQGGCLQTSRCARWVMKVCLVTSTIGCCWYHLLATYPSESGCASGRLQEVDSRPEPSPSPISHLALPPWDSPLWWNPGLPRPVCPGYPCPCCQGGARRRASHRCRAARPGAGAVLQPGLQHSRTQVVFQTTHLCV